MSWLHDLLALAGALAPVFLLLATGFALGRWKLISEAGNDSLDHLLYWVALPAQMIWILGREDVRAGFDPRCLAAAAGTFALGLFAAWQLTRRTAPARRGSLVNGVGRANGAFVGMPVIVLVAEAFPAEGAELRRAYAVLFACMVPLFNLGAVLAFRLAHAGQRPAWRDLASTARDIARNPIILASVAGIALALYVPGGLAHPAAYAKPLVQALELIALAAIPLALIATGSRIDPALLGHDRRALAWVTLAKLGVMPALTCGVGLALGLSHAALTAATVLMACPVAMASVPMARLLGGDARLMAMIITATTALSPLTLFLWLVVLRTLG